MTQAVVKLVNNPKLAKASIVTQIFLQLNLIPLIAEGMAWKVVQ